MTDFAKALIAPLRPLLPRKLRHFIHRAGAFVGGDAAFPSMYSTLVYLKQWGFEPQRVVDVGAYEGEWTRMIRRLYPGTQVLMVEPQAGKRPFLEQTRDRLAPGVDFVQELLGPENGREVTFVEMETGSSVLEEQTPDWLAKNRVQKTVRTLDDVVQSQGWPRVDLLKLDVQGYELEVLKGSERVLPTCEIVLMEASLIPVNTGCPTIDEVFSYMRARGFRVLDLCDMHRRKDHALWQVDVVFVNEASALVPEPRLTEENWF